jgi:8-oxo-dGTP pyrophosphatase MutT (NUDIX family)
VNDRRHVSCIAIFKESELKVFDRILLIQRGPDNKYPNQWCVPGGKVENDETEIQAAYRELAEETGLSFQLKDFGTYEFKEKPDLVYHLFVGKAVGSDGRCRLEDTFQGYGWFTKHDCEILDSFMSRSLVDMAWDSLD